MPRYWAKDLSVRLSEVGLQQSTPQPARNSQVKEVFSRNHEAIALVFNEGDKNGVLAETPLHSDEDELALQFLNRQENTPFAVILAGKASDAPPKSGALCLSVFLSERCFKINTPGQPGVAKDLKIDVFLDGVLCGSAFVSRRFATEKRSSTEKHKRTEHIVRFSGRRIGQYLEKPWVLLTPRGDEDNQLASTQAENTTAESNQLASTQAEDTTIESNQLLSTQAENITPGTKWNAVNATLLQYADEVGKDDTFLGIYLTGLASLPPPAEIGTFGNEDVPPRRRPYGIFDVVVTAGKGSKDAPQGGSLEKPTALRLGKIEPLKPAQVLAQQYAQDLSLLQTPSIPVTPVASRAPRQPSTRYRVPDAVKQAMSYPDQVKHRFVMPKTFVPEQITGFEVLGKRTREAYSTANTPQPSSSSSPAPNSAAALTPTPSRRAPPVASASATHPSTSGKTFTGEGSGFQPTQPRGWATLYDADVPLTQEEQMAKIQAEAAKSALQPKEPAPKPKSLVVVLKCDLSKLSTNDSTLSRPGSPPAPKRRRLNANAPNRPFMDAAEIARQEATFTPTTAGGVGYAAPGVVRQVRMERGGEFDEEEVVYGCRILV